MSRTTATIARNRQLLAAAVAFALVSVFVLQTSDAAFKAEFTNADNEFSTGTIELEGDHTAPLFGDRTATPAAVANGLDLKPGDVTEACIEITYTDSLENTVLTEVELTSNLDDPAGNLADDLEVELSVDADCDATPTYTSPVALPQLPSSTGWVPDASGEKRGFHFRVTVGDDAEQGASVDEIDLTWSVSTTS